MGEVHIKRTFSGHRRREASDKSLAEYVAESALEIRHRNSEWEYLDKTNQSKSETRSATECSDYENAQTKTLARHIEGCGFEATDDLIEKLMRKARFYGANGFVVAAAIDRAWRKVEGTSNRPEKPAWLLAVVENELQNCATAQEVAPAMPPAREERFREGSAPFDMSAAIDALARAKTMSQGVSR